MLSCGGSVGAGRWRSVCVAGGESDGRGEGQRERLCQALPLQGGALTAPHRETNEDSPAVLDRRQKTLKVRAHLFIVLGWMRVPASRAPVRGHAHKQSEESGRDGSAASELAERRRR
ncbi:hypothetical protein AOLI_G00183850 [Acnodon oligacanthus]